MTRKGDLMRSGLRPVYLSHREPSDARITATERQIIKQALTVLTPLLSDEALMLLAGGAEDAAWRKRAKQDGRPA
jgi:hypothetical protein